MGDWQPEFLRVIDTSFDFNFNDYLHRRFLMPSTSLERNCSETAQFPISFIFGSETFSPLP